MFTESNFRPIIMKTVNCCSTILKRLSTVTYQKGCKQISANSIITGLANIKAPGEDYISPEILKTCNRKMLKYVHGIILKIWDTGEIPREWENAIIHYYYY